MTKEQYKVLRSVQLAYRDYKVTTHRNFGRFFIVVHDETGPLVSASVSNDGEVTNRWRRQDA